MRKKLYEQKWDNEKIDSIVDILGDHIIQRRGVIGIDYPDGSGTYGITDPGEIDITESMVGGSVYRGEVIEAFAENEEEKYIISITESLYSMLWAEISRERDFAAEVYATYEDLLQAVKKLAEGKRPFNFVSCHTRRDICCYCLYWNGNKQMDPNKQLWVDPDLKGECTFQKDTDDSNMHLPGDVACKYYELLDLNDTWEKLFKNIEY